MSIGSRPDAIERGVIIQADLPKRGHEEGGERPAVVISTSPMNVGATIIIAPITATPSVRPRPYELVLSPDDSGLPFESVVLVHHMRVIDKAFILDRGRGRLTSAALGRLDVVIARVVLRAA